MNLAAKLTAEDKTSAVQIISEPEHLRPNHDTISRSIATAQVSGEVTPPITIDANTSSMWMAPAAKSGNVAALQRLL
jgi:hypothetical protein